MLNYMTLQRGPLNAATAPTGLTPQSYRPRATPLDTAMRRPITGTKRRLPNTSRCHKMQTIFHHQALPLLCATPDRLHLVLDAAPMRYSRCVTASVAACSSIGLTECSHGADGLEDVAERPAVRSPQALRARGVTGELPMGHDGARRDLVMDLVMSWIL